MIKSERYTEICLIESSSRNSTDIFIRITFDLSSLFFPLLCSLFSDFSTLFSFPFFLLPSFRCVSIHCCCGAKLYGEMENNFSSFPFWTSLISYTVWLTLLPHLTHCNRPTNSAGNSRVLQMKVGRSVMKGWERRRKGLGKSKSFCPFSRWFTFSHCLRYFHYSTELLSFALL